MSLETNASDLQSTQNKKEEKQRKREKEFLLISLLHKYLFQAII